MLPLELLRTRISRGTIEPLFSQPDDKASQDYKLAEKLLECFTDIHKTKNPKKILLKETSLLESQYDYKLVRGLVTLLERRSVFENQFTKTNPERIRQMLFEESVREGLALTEIQREKIVQNIAQQSYLSTQEVETAMWSDQEENLILEKFETINSEQLLFWYNLSLAQTLLFRCTSMEFYVQGGLYWKHVLRNVKRYGLMYNLEKQHSSDSISCILDGPLSLFKMTDRYGTAIAKLLPHIIKAPSWSMSGSIVKKNEDGQKLYRFSISDKEVAGIIQPVTDFLYQNNNSNKSQNTTTDESDFDSSLEANFEKSFLQHFDKKDDWEISREPDPLIADGKAMIADFLFERFGRKVYFEIVGFWTKEYMQRKTAKIKSIFEKNNQGKEQKIDLLIGVNEDLACSQLEAISEENVFTFKKQVSIKPILNHLRRIDREIAEEKIETTEIVLEGQPETIPIKQIAKKYEIPLDAALAILVKDFPEYVVVNESYMFSKIKMIDVKKSLEDVSKFVDACKILDVNEIDESCHADFLTKVGYDVVWVDLNPDNATITQRKSVK